MPVDRGGAQLLPDRSSSVPLQEIDVLADCLATNLICGEGFLIEVSSEAHQRGSIGSERLEALSARLHVGHELANLHSAKFPFTHNVGLSGFQATLILYAQIILKCQHLIGILVCRFARRSYASWYCLRIVSGRIWT